MNDRNFFNPYETEKLYHVKNLLGYDIVGAIDNYYENRKTKFQQSLYKLGWAFSSSTFNGYSLKGFDLINNHPVNWEIGYIFK